MGTPSRWHGVAVIPHTTVVGFVVRLFPCLIKYHDMKVCGRVEIQLHAFLTSVVDAGERVTFTSRSLQTW